MDIFHDKELWNFAAALIKEHGSAAAAYAADRARDALNSGDTKGYEVWLAALDAIGELQRRPEAAEKVDGGGA